MPSLSPDYRRMLAPQNPRIESRRKRRCSAYRISTIATRGVEIPKGMWLHLGTLGLFQGYLIKRWALYRQVWIGDDLWNPKILSTGRGTNDLPDEWFFFGGATCHNSATAQASRSVSTDLGDSGISCRGTRTQPMLDATLSQRQTTDILDMADDGFVAWAV